MCMYVLYLDGSLLSKLNCTVWLVCVGLIYAFLQPVTMCGLFWVITIIAKVSNLLGLMGRDFLIVQYLFALTSEIKPPYKIHYMEYNYAVIG